ncbi:MAG: hypothetical protein HN478_11905 [Rhodospirillaceae bacterium]|nr:hypothetical protein [Rhodospirillaceae bacterium]MBT4491570.1 hypothetical protein [Rhodospirillaceae bacterium]MBT5193748.1 hypothetical protein [Rhodospirillaceae bacterium]MBT5896223.1 hypothetical protein [Rhodospirillaceae bacterium]MBT6429040.1 hypothetical protein [Rhodospirillaceae bacterium]
MRLFDFLIVPVFRSGGTAIQRFVSLHPNIIAIPKWTLDEALENDQEEQLLESVQGAMQASPGTRFGLVQHKFTGAGGGLDVIVQRLSKIVRKNGLILLFRDHFDAVNSEINHLNIHQYCEYSFQRAGLDWPAEIDLSQDLEALRQASIAASPAAADATGRIRQPDEIWPELMSLLRYGAIQTSYEQHFNNPLILDYDQIFQPGDTNLMRDIFRFIGVDDGFHTPFYSTRQAGRSHRFLGHNDAHISSGNFTNLQVSMASRNISDFAIDRAGTEIAIMFDDYIKNDLGFSNGLSLISLSGIDLAQTGRKQQMMLRADAQRVMTEFLYPVWRHHYGAVSKVIDQFSHRELPGKTSQDLREALASDCAQFFAANRNFGQSWRMHN